MKIGVNARFLTKPYTGIGQHTRQLFEAMARLEPNAQFLLVTPDAHDCPMPDNVKTVVLPERFPGTAGMKKTYWEQRQLPKFFQEQQVDLVHFPYPSNPWQGFSKPVFVTVHDTFPWDSEAYRRSITTRLYQDSCRFAIKKADGIFTVSQASRDDIVRLCNVPRERVTLSYNAPAPHFSKRYSPEDRKVILQKYGLHPGRRYFFYVGGFDERKNVSTLVKAFQQHIALRYDVDLVLAGGKLVNDALYASFDHLLHPQNSGHPGKIVTTGFVDENDLGALYQSALALVNVSTREGCNLPLLESLASGTPVITSDLPVHHEMVGQHAVYVPPMDAEKLGIHMEQFLKDDHFYEARKAQAQSYVCPFSWEKTAGHVFDTYRRVSSGSIR
ncbi:MAG: glycosyltransferase family 1 protein [Candidatus Gracilibacteria bacterium]